MRYIYDVDYRDPWYDFEPHPIRDFFCQIFVTYLFFGVGSLLMLFPGWLIAWFLGNSPSGEKHSPSESGVSESLGIIMSAYAMADILNGCHHCVCCGAHQSLPYAAWSPFWQKAFLSQGLLGIAFFCLGRWMRSRGVVVPK